MEFDLTITVTSILGIAAIISPIVTSIINNRYLLKMRRLDAKIEQEKELSFYTREIFENYLKHLFGLFENQMEKLSKNIQNIMPSL